MGRTLYAGVEPTVPVTLGTSFLLVANGLAMLDATTTTEPGHLFAQACTFSKLTATCTSHAGTTTFITRNNAANGNQSISVTGTGTFVDNSGTDSVSAGNKFCVKDTESSTSQYSYVSVIGDTGAAGNTFKLGGDGTNTSPGTLYYGTDSVGGVSTESLVQTALPVNTTIQELQINVTQNTGSSAASTLTLRKNTANGNSTVSVGAATTGFFRDSSHTDTFVAGSDLIAYQLVFGTGTTALVWSYTADYVVAGDYFYVAYSRTSADAPTGWIGFLNRNRTGVSESSAQIALGTTVYVSNLVLVVSSNPNPAATYALRDNAVSTALSVSIPSTTTGTFTDTADTVTLDGTHLVDWQYNSPGAGVTMSDLALAYLVSLTSPTPPDTVVFGLGYSIH